MSITNLDDHRPTSRAEELARDVTDELIRAALAMAEECDCAGLFDDEICDHAADLGRAAYDYRIGTAGTTHGRTA